MSCDNGKAKQQNNPVVFSIIGLLTACVVICYFFADEPVFSWLRQNSASIRLNIFEKAFEQLGKVTVVIWLLLFWVWITGRHKTILIGFLALIITLPAVLSVKNAVGRMRPCDVIRAETKTEISRHGLDKWSFPSGDTAGICATGAVLATACPWPGIIAMTLCCTGVGFFRVWDMAHYPSDVMAGAALGIFCGWAAVRIRNRKPEIENIFGGAERIISFTGIVLIPIFVRIFQGREKFYILITFYAPVALVISLVALLFNKREKSNSHAGNC